jgi:hypothetical protein
LLASLLHQGSLEKQEEESRKANIDDVTSICHTYYHTVVHFSTEVSDIL